MGEECWDILYIEEFYALASRILHTHVTGILMATGVSQAVVSVVSSSSSRSLLLAVVVCQFLSSLSLSQSYGKELCSAE